MRRKGEIPPVVELRRLCTICFELFNEAMLRFVKPKLGSQ
jgi:hypothetical protein